MTFPSGTIRLDAAKNIFVGVELEQVKVGDKTVGYRAKMSDKVYEHHSLTELCKQLWQGK